MIDADSLPIDERVYLRRLARESDYRCSADTQRATVRAIQMSLIAKGLVEIFATEGGRKYFIRLTPVGVELIPAIRAWIMPELEAVATALVDPAKRVPIRHAAPVLLDALCQIANAESHVNRRAMMEIAQAAIEKVTT